MTTAKIDWDNIDTEQKPMEYYVPPGKYMGKLISVEEPTFSDEERPLIRLQFKIDSENEIISDMLRFYGGAVPVAVNKLLSMGLTRDNIGTEINLDSLVGKIEEIAVDSNFELQCSDYHGKDKDGNPKKTTSVGYYTKEVIPDF